MVSGSIPDETSNTLIAQWLVHPPYMRQVVSSNLTKRTKMMRGITVITTDFELVNVGSIPAASTKKPRDVSIVTGRKIIIQIELILSCYLFKSYAKS